MQIELTKEQYRTLLLLVNLGDWVINAHEVDARNEDVDELLQHILKYHKDFGETKLVDPAPDKGKFYETREMDDWMYKFIDEYDNETFWDELVDRLSERDFLRQHGEKKIEKMTTEQYLRELDEFEERYSKEFEENGLDNLSITTNAKSSN